MNPKLKKFFSYYRPYKGILCFDLFCAMAAAGISLVYPMIVRRITNEVLPNYEIGEAMQIIWKLGVVMLVLAVLEMLCNYFMAYQGHVMGTYMEYDMRNEIFAHFQKLSFNFYDDHKTGQLMSRITNDLFEVTELAHHGPEDILISVVKFVGAFIILVRIDWKLTVTAFLVIPLMVVFATLLRKNMRAASKRNRECIADINASIEDNLSGIRVVKSFANEEQELDNFVQANSRFLDSKSYFYKQMGRFSGGMNILTNLLSLVVITGGGLLIARGDVKVNDLLTFMLYVGNIVDPVKKIINFSAEQFQTGITGFERFYEIITTEPEIKDRDNAIELTKVHGDIEFKNVSFRYNDTLADVFSGIDLKVAAGEYVAIVGSSGVGKTTMCSLIPRFYEVKEGAVTIDGHDVRDVTLKSLRQNIGIVQQDVYLFAGTVKENIRYGKPGATDEEIIEAAKSANAHDFILGLPNGYDTYIGQRGVKLSGGQKQRLSIARVFLKNPPVLIFDEATSSLDNESEKVVQESLETLAKGRTTFVIAHRLTTIKNAERIVVLAEDGIKESGTHKELMEMDGIYAGLYKMHYV